MCAVANNTPFAAPLGFEEILEPVVPDPVVDIALVQIGKSGKYDQHSCDGFVYAIR